MARTVRRARIVAFATLCFLLSAATILLVNPPRSGIGSELRRSWEEVRGGLTLESSRALFEGIVSLGLFLLLRTFTILDMRYRHFLAFLAVSIVALLGVAPPQRLVESVNWSLIIYLAGSMSFAAILRKLGVFTYLATKIVMLSKGRALLLVLLLSALSWFTAMVIDEVTSVVYVIIIVLELGRLLKVEAEDLVLLAILSTNVGSLALPVGNPVGVYVAFTAGFTAADFLRRALTLSFICLLTTVLFFLLLRVKYVKHLNSIIAERLDALEAFVTTRIADTTRRERRIRVYGIALLMSFLVTVSASPAIADALSTLSGYRVEPNSFVVLVPYLYIVLTLPVAEISGLGEIIAKGVEWPSLIFLMFLSMLGYSLTWSGAMVRVAYATITLSRLIGPGLRSLFVTLLLASASLSAFMDNLSLIVALVPAVKLIVEITGAGWLFWSALFGTVLGGNLTPIGSTANIVAVSMIERRRRARISWSRWLRLALPIVAAHCLIASAWGLAVT